MTEDPSRPPEDVTVLVAVMINRAGHYVAFGDSQYRHGKRPQREDHLLEMVRAQYEDSVGGHDDEVTHVKFLEVVLQTPDMRPVNIEAQPREEVHPSVGVTDGPVLREDDR